MFKSISLLFIGCGFLAAQCNYTSTMSKVGTIVFDNSVQGCSSWQLSYMSSGFSGLIIQAESSSDPTTVPYGLVQASNNPSSLLVNSITFSTISSSIRINLRYTKGNGSIFFTLTGSGGGGSGTNTPFSNVTSGTIINQNLVLSSGSFISAINGGQIYATNLSRAPFSALGDPATYQWQTFQILDHMFDNSCLATSLMCFSNGAAWYQVVGPSGGGGGGGSGTVGNGSSGQFAFYTSTGTAVSGRSLVIGDIPTAYPYANLSGTATGITPGNYGSATNCPYITVAADGRITAISQSTSCPGGSGGGGVATSVTGGLLSAIPATCTTKDVYFATDQPANQQLYTCSATNNYTQGGNLGGSGALAMTSGSLDVNLDMVPIKTNSETISGVYNFTNGLGLLTSNSKPTCAVGIRGNFWYTNGGASKDSLEVCVYTGSAYTWNTLY